MMINRIKIIKNDSYRKLQQNANIYMENIVRLGAVILKQPQIQIMELNSAWLKKYIKSAIISKYNQSSKTILNFKSNAKLSIIKKVTPKLYQEIKKNEANVSPIQYYVQIYYKVKPRTLKAHLKFFV